MAKKKIKNQQQGLCRFYTKDLHKVIIFYNIHMLPRAGRCENKYNVDNIYDVFP